MYVSLSFKFLYLRLSREKRYKPHMPVLIISAISKPKHKHEMKCVIVWVTPSRKRTLDSLYLVLKLLFRILTTKKFATQSTDRPLWSKNLPGRR